MKTRDHALVLSVLVLLIALAAVVVGAGGTEPNGAEDPHPDLPVVTENTGGGNLGKPMEASVSPRQGTAPSERTENVEGRTGRTSGLIRGDITLDASVVAKLEAVFVRAREAVGPGVAAEYDKTHKIDIRPSAGTPTFSLEPIPFSEHGYAVSVYSEGNNGSEQIVPLNAKHPIAEVRLGVTAGVHFTVLLRDQLKAPVVDQRVFMVPVGKPLNRPRLQLVSDAFGAAVFRNVLQGSYDVAVANPEQPRNAPVQVQVLAHAGPGSVTVEVPRGRPLEVLVSIRHGWGIPGATLDLQQTDTKRLRKLPGETDRAGRFVFEHVPGGEYQLNVTAEGYQRWTRRVVVVEDAPNKTVEVAMVRLR